MRLKPLAILLIAAVAVTALPITNYINGKVTAASFESKSDFLKDAFKTDMLVGICNVMLTRLGISTSPKDVIIGKNNWMFLGDWYAGSVSSHRGLLTPSKSQIEEISKQRQHWKKFAKSRNSDFYVTVSPNKEDVYDEFLPDWARAGDKKNFPAIMREEHDDALIYLYDQILQAKSKYSVPIYYRTDSHWNELGAWEGYKYMASRIKLDHPDLVFLTDKDISIDESGRKPGGDLANFLFMKNLTTDGEPHVSIANDPVIGVLDIDKNATKYHGPNKRLDASLTPLIVSSSSALNDKRVLWLHDSYGQALSPYMSATFKETYRQHWGPIMQDRAKFEALIDSYKPDLIIVTSVLRSYLEITLAAKPSP
ncbi:hypothetical protein D3C78_401720 [compost metagenome]